jgi:hypothetical protein
MLTLYNTQTWTIIHSSPYSVEKVLGRYKITLMMLSNMIEDAIPHEYLE